MIIAEIKICKIYHEINLFKKMILMKTKIEEDNL